MGVAGGRIGLYGGAFDPPHLAHLALARAAVQQLALDRLHVVPTGDAWHKERTLSPAAQRLALCELAFAELPQALVDDRELLRSGPSYTLDTLRELRAEYPEAALFLVIGSDEAAAFARWYRPRQILQLATVAIVARGGPADGQWQGEDPLPGVPHAPGQVRLLQLPPMTHSATEARQRAAARQALDELLPATVARYIEDHDLYRNPA